jgi:hypothetical protein
MNIYDDQTDLVLASWRATRRRERLAFWITLITLGGLGVASACLVWGG